MNGELCAPTSPGCVWRPCGSRRAEYAPPVSWNLLARSPTSYSSSPETRSRSRKSRLLLSSGMVVLLSGAAQVAPVPRKGGQRLSQSWPCAGLVLPARDPLWRLLILCGLDQTPNPARPLDVLGHHLFRALNRELGPFEALLGTGDFGRHRDSPAFRDVCHGIETPGGRNRSLSRPSGAPAISAAGSR